MSNILIIGNGFDQQLGLSTKYADFVNSKFWPLKEPDSEHEGEENLYNYIYNFTEKQRDNLGKVRWIDLEDLLFSYVKTKIGKAVKFESDKDIVKYDREIFKRIKIKFVQYLVNIVWPQFNLRCKSGNCISDIIEPIIQNGKFSTVYTFNYTDTGKILEFLYSWSPSVIHLHGKVTTNSQKIILGIGDVVAENIPREYRFMLKSNDEAFRSHELSNDLSKADDIVFFGLSFGIADIEYFKDFIQDSIKKYTAGVSKKFIHIITKDEASRENILNAFQDVGINMSKFYKAFKLHFYKIDEFGISSNGTNPFQEFKRHMIETELK